MTWHRAVESHHSSACLRIYKSSELLPSQDTDLFTRTSEEGWYKNADMLPSWASSEACVVM